MKYYLQILAFLSGSSFGIALALFLSFFDFQNIIFEYILVYLGSIFLLILTYGIWKTREKNKIGVTKNVIYWVIHNLKFLFTPGSHLDDLDERQRQHELLYPRINRIHRYKTVLFIEAAACIIKVDFPIPGSPPTSTSRTSGGIWASA